MPQDNPQGYTDKPFEVPAGMSQEEVMDLWQGFVTKSPEKQKQLATQSPIFGQFKTIKDMGADVTFANDVELPADTTAETGASLALRLIGAGGGGFLAATGAGAPLGAAFAGMANAGANMIDKSVGQPTEAIPFSGLVSSILGVENPATTGNPLIDAAAETMVDQIPLLGSLKALGQPIGRLFGKGAMTEYVAKNLNKEFVQDLTHLEKMTGEELELTLKGKGIGGDVVDALASMPATKLEDEALIRKNAETLTEMWKKSFKIDATDPVQVQGVVDGFNEGLEWSKQVKRVGGLLPEQVNDVILSTRFRRTLQGLYESRKSAEQVFLASDPVAQFTGQTAGELKNAVRTLNSFGIKGDSKLAKLKNNLDRMYNTMLSSRENTIKDARGTRLVFSLRDQLLDSEKNPKAPFTILRLLDNIDEQIKTVGKQFPPAQAKDIEEQLLRVKNSVSVDIENSLNSTQRGAYASFRDTTEQINSMPMGIMKATESGKFSGLMEGLISDPEAAKKFLQQGVVSQTEAKSMLGEYLLAKGAKIAEDGSESIDWVGIKKLVDDPKLRDGIVTMLGSDDLQVFRQFANVAANVAPRLGTGSLARRALYYSPIAGTAGMFILNNPTGAAVGAAGGLGLAVASDKFFKKVLFNPKIGRDAIDLLKNPSNTAQTRKAYGAILAALNGHEALALALNEDGEPTQTKRVVVRQGVGGRPTFEALSPNAQ